jgi:diketogulonate reductase-like aldo/keto reductase
MQKTPYVFPIIGGRKIENLKANLEALDLTLGDEQIKELESVVPFDLGFPSNFIVSLLNPEMSKLSFVLTLLLH